MPKDFIGQIREDIKRRREGTIPNRYLTAKMFNLLKRNKFIVCVKSSVNLQPDIEIINECEDEQIFAVYRPKETDKAMKMRNQKRIDEYG